MMARRRRAGARAVEGASRGRHAIARRALACLRLAYQPVDKFDEHLGHLVNTANSLLLMSGWEPAPSPGASPRWPPQRQLS